jgi:hypothetical protein
MGALGCYHEVIFFCFLHRTIDDIISHFREQLVAALFILHCCCSVAKKANTFARAFAYKDFAIDGVL